jgi:hypothetical protein
VVCGVGHGEGGLGWFEEDTVMVGSSPGLEPGVDRGRILATGELVAWLGHSKFHCASTGHSLVAFGWKGDLGCLVVSYIFKY